jgi:putative N6-adenine-specific DNA methylase
MEEFYKNIGDTLKKNYPGTNSWFITGNLEALKFVGLRPSRKLNYSMRIEARCKNTKCMREASELNFR